MPMRLPASDTPNGVSALCRLILCSPMPTVMAMWHRTGPMDMSTAAMILLAGLFSYSAWQTSIVFCSSNGLRRC